MINWSDVKEPNSDCRYHHISANTPFGDFLITWKGWKKYNSPSLDETPWGDLYMSFNDVESAKEYAEKEFQNKLEECLEDKL